MYDNVDLTLPAYKVKGIDLLNEIPSLLTGISQTIYENGNVSITGYVGGLKVRLSQTSLKVRETSLCKYFLGDNMQTMTRGDIKGAIERMSDELHLPMTKATVTRIDVAQNLVLKHNESLYLNHLGELQYFKRMPQSNGLYYQNENRTILFYGKIKEQTVKGFNIPEIYNGKNLLRYEQRYKKRLLEYFNVPELTALMLYDQIFYSNIVDRWRADYLKIKKINSVQIDYHMIKTKKDQAMQAILFYVKQRGGLLKVIEEINEGYKTKELTKKQAHDLKSQVEEACKYELLTCKSELIEELDQKIKEATRFCL